jgi:membrane protease YdiL (CAAX protease family)
VLALVATVGLDELFVSILHPRTVNPFGGIAQQSTLAIVTAGLAACVTAPVVEEIFFRGLIYRCLRNRCSTLPAALVAAILFAGVHAPSYSPGALPGIACFGLIACLLYERTGSLLPGIALHSLIDANVFEVNLTGHAGVVLVVFLLLGLGLLARGAFTTARRRRTRRTAAG